MRQSARMLLLMASVLLLSACAAANWPKEPEPEHPGERVANLAERFIGSPYRFGGASPYGFDCSGLVMYTHRKAGIDVPRTAEEQFREARQVAADGLRSGDLLFFRINGTAVSHVGIYVGDGRFVHAPSFGEQVELAEFDRPYWRKQFAGAGRLY